jgi:hypothetical protein
MKYKIVTHWRFEEVESQILLLLCAGWTLQGGVSVAISPGGEVIFAQALIKED